MKVLLIDDKPHLLAFYKNLLEDYLKYDVVAVEHFSTAVDVFRHNKNIGLVISDYNLHDSEANGCELLKLLLAIREVPTILVSGTNIEELYEKCLPNSGILEKPWAMRDIERKIKEVTGG